MPFPKHRPGTREASMGGQILQKPLCSPEAVPPPHCARPVRRDIELMAFEDCSIKARSWHLSLFLKISSSPLPTKHRDTHNLKGKGKSVLQTCVHHHRSTACTKCFCFFPTKHVYHQYLLPAGHPRESSMPTAPGLRPIPSPTAPLSVLCPGA